MSLIEELIRCVMDALEDAQASGSDSINIGERAFELGEAHDELDRLLCALDIVRRKRTGAGNRSLTTRQAFEVWDRKSRHPSGTEGRILDTVTTALHTGASIGLVRAIWSGKAYRDEVQKFRTRRNRRRTA